ncbi:MAG: hypothetical protein KY467_01875 [Gemmatimonadetes bacterium]|nr:hypothetical protein [Gemmatimonadota bacterium]
MSTRRITTAAAAAALTLLASACSDRLTSPAVHPGAPALNTGSTLPQLVPNSVRYSDTGGRPATGRSGSATLSAFALRARDGVTSLEVRAGRADGVEGGTAELAHVQVKALIGGQESYVANHREGLDAPIALPALARGEAVQVQANVRGIDGNRTDVVTVTETVKLRPDLAVTFSAAETVSPGVPVSFTALVEERNGDVGATATCQLRVDGAVVDQAQGIWVDAGDAVSCAFTYTFAQAGTYAVEVAATGTAPADWDESNNAASAQVRVAAPGVPLQFTAIAEQKVGYRHSMYINRYADARGVWYEQERRDTADEHLQTIQMLGSSAQPIPGPVVVEVSQATGGRTLHAARWASGTPPGVSWCTSIGHGATMFFGCSLSFGGFSYAQFMYTRYGGTVTYHGTIYTRTWWDGVMQEYVYHRNFRDGYLPPVQLGNDFQFNVRITAADGTVYRAEADFPLAASIEQGGTPETCTRYHWYESAYQETCSSSAFRYEVLSGRAQWPAAF